LQALSKIEDLLYDIQNEGYSKEKGSKVLIEYGDYISKYGTTEEDVLMSNRYERPFALRSGRSVGYEEVMLTYRETLDNIYKRDMLRLLKNRNTLKGLYSTQENWIKDMKSQVARHTYGFPLKY